MKYLHTMVRVLDLEKSLHFYRDLLGLKVTRKTDVEAGRFTLVYLTLKMESLSGVNLVGPTRAIYLWSQLWSFGICCR